jgi:hypothetical protein
MKTKNAPNVSGGSLAGAQIHVGDCVNVRVSNASKRAAAYPKGGISANLAKRNYVKYLVERYNHYRAAARQAPGCSDQASVSQLWQPTLRHSQTRRKTREQTRFC